MSNSLKSRLSQLLRKHRVRARVVGTAARPRLSVYISNRHINVQLVDDVHHTTITSIGTVGNKDAAGTMTERAATIGKQIAGKAKKAKVTKVVFDRGSRAYAGRMQALADAARKEGLEF